MSLLGYALYRCPVGLIKLTQHNQLAHINLEVWLTFEMPQGGYQDTVLADCSNTGSKHVIFNCKVKHIFDTIVPIRCLPYYGRPGGPLQTN